jgi:hypothetical protein
MKRYDDNRTKTSEETPDFMGSGSEKTPRGGGKQGFLSVFVRLDQIYKLDAVLYSKFLKNGIEMAFDGSDGNA